MITIFNGRTRSLRGTDQTIYVQISVAMRGYLHLFKNEKNANPLSVFLCIAFHANENGWAWPSVALIMKETGLTDPKTITASLTHLRSLQIEGQPVLYHYRVNTKGKWGKSYYHIFPAAGGEPPTHVQFAADSRSRLLRYIGQCGGEKPEGDKPLVDNPLMGNPPHKNNHLKVKPDNSNGVSPSANPTTIDLDDGSIQQPPSSNHPKGKAENHKSKESTASMTPMTNLEARIMREFPDVKTRYRLLDELNEPVRVGNGFEPSPNELYDSDSRFEEWAEGQIAYWKGKYPKPTHKNLSHLIRLLRLYFVKGSTKCWVAVRDDRDEEAEKAERMLAQWERARERDRALFKNVQGEKPAPVPTEEELAGYNWEDWSDGN